MKHRHIKAMVRGAINRRRYSRFIRILGPGVVTGAADDDPSGIATYSQTGAMMGYSMLWTLPAMYPLLLGVQDTCSRIGAVTGKGLAAVIKEHYNRKMLIVAVCLVLVANVINIGADLGAMAAALELVAPVPFALGAVLFTVVVLLLQILVPYKHYARILKWLALLLFAYPVTAFVVGQPWGEVLQNTLVPRLEFNPETIYLLVGLLGTTISPYLFFWDTSEVTEEEIAKRRLGMLGLRPPKITRHFIRSVRLDNFAGMTLASATAWFIMLTCATVLFGNGITEINTAADAAKAIEPMVSNFPHAGLIAKLIFAVGIIGLGLLAVPVLGGSAAYALSETFGWREGFYRKFKKALGFYAIIITATLVGLLINFLGIDPIDALIFSAVFNGIAAVPLIFMIARIGSNREIMGEYKNTKISSSVLWLTFGLMFVSCLLLIIVTIFNR